MNKKKNSKHFMIIFAPYNLCFNFSFSQAHNIIPDLMQSVYIFFFRLSLTQDTDVDSCIGNTLNAKIKSWLIFFFFFVSFYLRWISIRKSNWNAICQKQYSVIFIYLFFLFPPHLLWFVSFWFSVASLCFGNLSNVIDRTDTR